MKIKIKKQIGKNNEWDDELIDNCIFQIMGSFLFLSLSPVFLSRVVYIRILFYVKERFCPSALLVVFLN